MIRASCLPIRSIRSTRRDTARLNGIGTVSVTENLAAWQVQRRVRRRLLQGPVRPVGQYESGRDDVGATAASVTSSGIRPRYRQRPSTGWATQRPWRARYSSTAIFSEQQARKNPFEDTPWGWALRSQVHTD